MKRLTQSLAALVCVAALGYLSLATANDAKASANDTVTLDAAVTIDQSAAIATPQEVVAADCNRCYQISNPDSKNFCLATCKNDSNRCYQIRNQDRKNYCLATVKRDKNRCYQIRDKDLKQQCLAQAG
jgi:hypothetical protein